MIPFDMIYNVVALGMIQIHTLSDFYDVISCFQSQSCIFVFSFITAKPGCLILQESHGNLEKCLFELK